MFFIHQLYTGGGRDGSPLPGGTAWRGQLSPGSRACDGEEPPACHPSTWGCWCQTPVRGARAATQKAAETDQRDAEAR